MGAVIVWCSLHAYDNLVTPAFETSALVLTVAGAVLCADFITGRTQAARGANFNWIGVTALVAGILTPMAASFFMAVANPYWHPWLLAAFGMGFLIALVGGAVQRLAVRA